MSSVFVLKNLTFRCSTRPCMFDFRERRSSRNTSTGRANEQGPGGTVESPTISRWGQPTAAKLATCSWTDKNSRLAGSFPEGLLPPNLPDEQSWPDHRTHLTSEGCCHFGERGDNRPLSSGLDKIYRCFNFRRHTAYTELTLGEVPFSFIECNIR